MTTRRTTWIATAAFLALALGAAPFARQAPAARLSDQEFRTLIDNSSEPSGLFDSENLVSNEARFQGILPALTQAAVPGRAYVGVGSEQNFTYIAGVRPVIAFIVDLRRGNLDLHLAYKRSSRCPRIAPSSCRGCSRVPGPRVSAHRPPRPRFSTRIHGRRRRIALRAELEGDRDASFDQTRLPAQRGRPRRTEVRVSIVVRGGQLRAVDQRHGPGPGAPGGRGSGGVQPPGGRRGGFGPGGVPGMPTYADLMTADDGTGKRRSYLATEETSSF
jgi:hypothetical protein